MIFPLNYFFQKFSNAFAAAESTLIKRETLLSIAVEHKTYAYETLIEISSYLVH